MPYRLSERAQRGLLSAFGDPKAVEDLIDDIENIGEVGIDIHTVKINQLIDAYTALVAKLNADADVADTDYGTGPTAPPTKL